MWLYFFSYFLAFSNILVFNAFFRSALQTLHKVSGKAREQNYFLGGLSHDWVSYYEQRIESDRSCLNEWHAMDNLESKRPPSPDSVRTKWVNHFCYDYYLFLLSFLSSFSLFLSLSSFLELPEYKGGYIWRQAVQNIPALSLKLSMYTIQYQLTIASVNW